MPPPPDDDGRRRNTSPVDRKLHRMEAEAQLVDDAEADVDADKEWKKRPDKALHGPGVIVRRHSGICAPKSAMHTRMRKEKAVAVVIDIAVVVGVGEIGIGFAKVATALAEPAKFENVENFRPPLQNRRRRQFATSAEGCYYLLTVLSRSSP